MGHLAQQQPPRLRFGSFELDRETRDLRKHGLRVKLPPQAFSVLVCLIENPGELVTREELISRLWPEDTHVEFDGNLNAITRVLREALGDSARNPRFIETEPKLGYRFIAPVSVIADPHPDAQVGSGTVPQPERRKRWRLGAAAAIVGLVVMVGALLWRGLFWSTPPLPAGRLTQLTHFLGIAGHPTFSPDGERVAFHWNGGTRGDYEIYTLGIGSGDLHRLTNDPADDTSPAWSPDGRDIAFLRSVSPSETAIMLVPVTGGAERRVALLPKVLSLAWSPDGRWIAYSLSAHDNPFNPLGHGGISAISLATGQTAGLTPLENGNGDAYPAFSPDGRTLAFVRHSDVWTLPIDGGLKPLGSVRRLTAQSSGARDLVWTRDSRSVIFAAERGVYHRLWRVAVRGAQSTPVEIGGEDAFEPALDPAGSHVVYSRSAVVDSLATLKLCGAGCVPESPQRLVYATKLARNPSYSPDGGQIAFESSGSGHMEIWLCGRDGSEPRQLTNLGGPPAGTPNWSPDGKQLVFDARVAAGSAIFTIAASGGPARQITSGSTEDLVPFWSRDGKRIYFASQRSGSLEIWSMSLNGSNPTRITRLGGFRPVESYDGQYLYYAKSAAQTSIWRVPVAGGEEKPVVNSLSYWQNFSVVPAGIYLAPSEAGRSVPIQFYDSASATTLPVGNVETCCLQGLSASSDNRTLVLSRREFNERDLMLLDVK